MQHWRRPVRHDIHASPATRERWDQSGVAGQIRAGRKSAGTGTVRLIYFSYGMTKSASSFAYQLVQGIVKGTSMRLLPVPPAIRGNKAPENYVEPLSEDVVGQILDWLPQDAATVIKTHGRPRSEVSRMVRGGTAFACATFRDPRDIAVSMLDHGRRSREAGIADFAQFETPRDTVDDIKRQIGVLDDWVGAEKTLLLPFDLLRLDPVAAVSDVLGQLGLEGDPAAIAADLKDTRKIIHFNVGTSGRYRTAMSQEDQALFARTFADFIAFYEKALADRGLAA